MVHVICSPTLSSPSVAVLTLNKITDSDDDPFKEAVAVMNIVVWFSLVSLPIIQVRRVSCMYVHAHVHAHVGWEK